MNSLPLDISLSILSRLPFVTLMNCKCISKFWHALVKHPLLPSLQLAFLESQNNLCLILHSSPSCSPHDQLFDFCCLRNEDEHHQKDIMKRIKIPLKNHKFTSVLHCNGLLCLSYNESDKLVMYDKLCVYNLFTAQLTSLPSHSVIKGLKVAYGFGFHPRTEEYKVVRIVEQECVRSNMGRFELSLDQSIKVFTLGTHAWRITRNNHFLLRMQPSEALINGALHWLAQAKLRHSQTIVSFDLADERFCQISSPNCRLDVLESHLLVLGGCLSLAVYIEKSKIDIWVMRNYGMEESWTKEFTINFESSPLGSIRPLCFLKNGKVLIEYAKQSLFSYDPQMKKTRKIKIGDFLHSFQAVPHVVTINSAMPLCFGFHSFV